MSDGSRPDDAAEFRSPVAVHSFESDTVTQEEAIDLAANLLQPSGPPHPNSETNPPKPFPTTIDDSMLSVDPPKDTSTLDSIRMSNASILDDAVVSQTKIALQSFESDTVTQEEAIDLAANLLQPSGPPHPKAETNSNSPRFIYGEEFFVLYLCNFFAEIVYGLRKVIPCVELNFPSSTRVFGTFTCRLFSPKNVKDGFAKNMIAPMYDDVLILRHPPTLIDLKKLRSASCKHTSSAELENLDDADLFQEIAAISKCPLCQTAPQYLPLIKKSLKYLRGSTGSVNDTERAPSFLDKVTEAGVEFSNVGQIPVYIKFKEGVFEKEAITLDPGNKECVPWHPAYKFNEEVISYDVRLKDTSSAPKKKDEKGRKKSTKDGKKKTAAKKSGKKKTAGKKKKEKTITTRTTGSQKATAAKKNKEPKARNEGLAWRDHIIDRNCLVEKNQKTLGQFEEVYEELLKSHRRQDQDDTRVDMDTREGKIVAKHETEYDPHDGMLNWTGNEFPGLNSLTFTVNDWNENKMELAYEDLVPAGMTAPETAPGGALSWMTDLGVASGGGSSTMTAVGGAPMEAPGGALSWMTDVGGAPKGGVVTSTPNCSFAVFPADLSIIHKEEKYYESAEEDSKTTAVAAAPGGGRSTMTAVGAAPGGRSTMTAVGAAPGDGASTMTAVGGAPIGGGASTMTAVGGAPVGGCASTMTAVGGAPRGTSTMTAVGGAPSFGAPAPAALSGGRSTRDAVGSTLGGGRSMTTAAGADWTLAETTFGTIDAILEGLHLSDRSLTTYFEKSTLTASALREESQEGLRWRELEVYNTCVDEWLMNELRHYWWSLVFLAEESSTASVRGYDILLKEDATNKKKKAWKHFGSELPTCEFSEMLEEKRTKLKIRAQFLEALYLSQYSLMDSTGGFLREKSQEGTTIATMTEQVHIPLVPVERAAYNGGSNILKDHISAVDPEVYSIMKTEKARQHRGLELIASENFTSKSVMDALGSTMYNKYSEGYPGARYDGGNEYIGQMDLLCQKRALQVFGLNSELWGVSVQSLSGSPANFAVYTALVEPNGRIMGLDLPDGGNLSHGFITPARTVSPTSIFFQPMLYKQDPETGLIDYDKLEENAMLFRPKILVAGVSCYPRHLDYARFRKIADKCGAFLMADMAHISGLVAAGLIPTPFEYVDIVTTTTHISLRGPCGTLIFFRKGVRSTNANGDKVMYDLGDKIASAVFPGLQGGPHNHTITGIAVALKQCLAEDFVNYSKQVLKNSKALAERLTELGYSLATGGTENHLLLVDLRHKGLEGAKAEHVLDLAHIACNKNTCPGEVSALTPGGIRLGSPALTSRGFKEEDFKKVAEYIDQGINIALKYQSQAGNTFKDFKTFTESNADFQKEIKALAADVEVFATKFEIPGNDEA